MLARSFPKFRFRLVSVFILMAGIAIGYSLNMQTIRLITGASSEASMGTLPVYRIEPPDVLYIELQDGSAEASPLAAGKHLVGPDGTINLQKYGRIYVAGLTISEAKAAVERKLAEQTKTSQIILDVHAYNSKSFYVVEQGKNSGDQVTRLPITGKETVLDAVAQIGGIRAQNSAQIWIARPPRNGVGRGKKLEVDWDKVTRGVALANYQLLPGDRIFIKQKANSTSVN